MIKKNIPAFVVYVFIIAIACNTDKKTDVTCKKLVSLENPVTIQNQGNSKNILTISWKNSFANFDSILSAINRLPNDYLNEPLERKSWRFVIKQMDFFRNPLQSSEIHHPLVLLNSLGYGQCDDLSTLLYFIWIKQGFKARIWGLGKHVVPEVYVNGKWQMYDPSFQAYYLNKSGMPASVQELTANNQLILNPYKTITVSEKNNLDAKIVDSLRYGMSVCKHYLSDSGHIENKSYYKTSYVSDFLIEIPRRSSITLPVYNPTILTQKDWLFRNRNNHYYLKLNIPANTTGIIKIPLILVAVEGDIELQSFTNKNKTFKFVGKNTKPLEIIDTSLFVLKTNKTTHLYYKIPEEFNNPTPISISLAKNQLLHTIITQKNK